MSVTHLVAETSRRGRAPPCAPGSRARPGSAWPFIATASSASRSSSTRLHRGAGGEPVGRHCTSAGQRPALIPASRSRAARLVPSHSRLPMYWPPNWVGYTAQGDVILDQRAPEQLVEGEGDFPADHAVDAQLPARRVDLREDEGGVHPVEIAIGGDERGDSPGMPRSTPGGRAGPAVGATVERRTAPGRSPRWTARPAGARPARPPPRLLLSPRPRPESCAVAALGSTAHRPAPVRPVLPRRPDHPACGPRQVRHRGSPSGRSGARPVARGAYHRPPGVFGPAGSPVPPVLLQLRPRLGGPTRSTSTRSASAAVAAAATVGSTLAAPRGGLVSSRRKRRPARRAPGPPCRRPAAVRPARRSAAAKMASTAIMPVTRASLSSEPNSVIANSFSHGGVWAICSCPTSTTGDPFAPVRPPPAVPLRARRHRQHPGDRAEDRPAPGPGISRPRRLPIVSMPSIRCRRARGLPGPVNWTKVFADASERPCPPYRLT